MNLLQDRKTQEWICINCGFGSMTPPRDQGPRYEPSEPETQRRLRLLNRVAEQFGTDKVDEILKDNPSLKQLWQQQLLEDVAMEFGRDKVETLVRDQPELKDDWDRTQVTEEAEPFRTKGRRGPSGMWYFVPAFFSLLGGLISYVALKDRDEAMADTCLVFGIVVFVAEALATFWFRG